MGEGKRMVRFGIVGCGTIAAFHAAAIAQLENARLLGVWDALPEAARRFAGERGVRAYETMEAMLEDAEIDAVCICTPSGFHGAQAIDAVRHGKHVALEKPMCLELSQADELARLAGQNGCQVCVISQLRFSPAMRALKDAVEKKAFGRVVSGSLSMKYYRSDEYYASSSWRGTWRMDGGGALMNQCTHNIDLLRWMMGDDVTEVMAYTDNLEHDYIEAEDLGMALIRFGNGAYGIVEGTTNVYPHNLEETLYLFGEDGTVKAGGKSVNVIESWDFRDGKDDPAYIKENFGENPPNVYGFGHTPLYRDMIEAIQNDRPPYVDGEAGMRALELVLAIYQSAATGRPVSLPLGHCASTDFAGRFDR